MQIRIWAEWYLWVGEPCRIGVQVVLDAMEGSRKGHSSEKQHHQHQEGECGCDVGSLHLSRKWCFYKLKTASL